LESKPKTVKFLLASGLSDLIDAKNIMEKTAFQICLSDLRKEYGGHIASVDSLDPKKLRLHQQCFSELLAKGAALAVSQNNIQI
jgi:hypothetical protein